MPAKIYPKRRRQVFLAEWRDHRGLTQQQLAERLGCDIMTVSRWELGKTAVSVDALSALSEALGGDLMEPEDLFHHPDQPTPNQLLRDQAPAIQDQAMKMIKAIRSA